MKAIFVLLLLVVAFGSLGAEALVTLGPGMDLVSRNLDVAGELNFAALGFQGLVFSGNRLGFLAAASFSFLPLGIELNGAELSPGSFDQSFVLDLFWGAAYRLAAGERFRLLTALGLHGAQLSLVHETDPLKVFGRELALGAGVNLSAHYKLRRRLLLTLQLKGAYDFYSYAYFKDRELSSGISLGGNLGVGVAF